MGSFGVVWSVIAFEFRYKIIIIALAVRQREFHRSHYARNQFQPGWCNAVVHVKTSTNQVTRSATKVSGFLMRGSSSAKLITPNAPL